MIGFECKRPKKDSFRSFGYSFKDIDCGIKGYSLELSRTEDKRRFDTHDETVYAHDAILLGFIYILYISYSFLRCSKKVQKCTI